MAAWSYWPLAIWYSIWSVSETCVRDFFTDEHYTRRAQTSSIFSMVRWIWLQLAMVLIRSTTDRYTIVIARFLPIHCINYWRSLICFHSQICEVEKIRILTEFTKIKFICPHKFHFLFLLNLESWSLKFDIFSSVTLLEQFCSLKRWNLDVQSIKLLNLIHFD